MVYSERDLHVLKYFSSVVTVMNGKVVNVTEPFLRHCPLASHFYPSFKEADSADVHSLCVAIREAIESKIRDHGFFTKDRSFRFPAGAVPFGASEMLASFLQKKLIEAAVVVCDGAGTVIAASPELVQGMGARMNTLIFTSPIKEIQRKLKAGGCHVVSEDTAWIDQFEGVKKALSIGYKNIAVTVAGYAAEQLESIRALEVREGARVTILVVCTTGISDDKIKAIGRYADLVWACASGEVRDLLGKKARLQLSQEIPVYALTERGMGLAGHFLGASSTDLADRDSQYLVSREAQGISLGAGKPGYYLRVASLPVAGSRGPR